MPSEAWEVAASAAAPSLPGGPEVLADRGWTGLMEHILGEGQFGSRGRALTTPKRFYYHVKPLLPRRLVLATRRRYRARQMNKFPLGWPIEPRYAAFLHLAVKHVSAQFGYDDHDPLASLAASRLRCRDFWPEGARFAFVLTHDVETRVGCAAVRRLADLDERYGFRSAFNFVAQDYPVDLAFLAELRAGGFEVGLHGLHHDARLFSSEGEFARHRGAVNQCLRDWQAVGFRAPYVLREPQFLQSLDIEYDASCFDTDPFEPMPGGTMSIWPFWCGRFIELPYTLPQDHTLLVLLSERTPRLWLEKVDFIARWGGMALVNVHPDYMLEPSHWAVYEAFLDRMASVRTGWELHAEDGTNLGLATYWHALPTAVARWWRARSGV